MFSILLSAFILVVLLAIYYYFFYRPSNASSPTNPIDQCSLMYDRDRIYEYDNLLTPQECQTIIQLAAPHVSRSHVLSKQKYNKSRTSSHTFLKSNVHPIIEKIDQIVYSYLKIPIENYESLQVVNYKSTQKYDAHYDACDPEEEICQDDMKRGGLRYATFIIYLNDDFEGGETEFPIHNYKAKPKTGKAVLFFNLDDRNQTRRHNSFHGGLPPTTGEKWMCNKWIRLGKFA